MKDRKSLTGLIQLWGIILFTGIGVSVVCIEIVSTLKDFTNRAGQTRNNYISQQKEMIKREVSHVVNLINYEKTQSEVLVRKKIKTRVNEAYAIASNIYRNNKISSDKSAIHKMIFDALRPVRFKNGTGYYFAIKMDGQDLLFSDRPENEGRNMLQIKDTRGQYVVKDMLSIAKKSGEGFYEYHWTKPGTMGNDFKKISFIKMFEPLGFIIGAGLYVEDVENLLKSNLLSTISRIRYGKEGYIFVNRFNGDALVSSGKVVSGKKKLWEVFNKNPEKTKEIFQLEYDAALKPGGEYIYYSIIKLSKSGRESPKTSFIYGVNDWQWLIGSGVYLDDVESVIAVMHDHMIQQIRSKILKFTLFVMVTLTFFLLLFSRINRRLRNDFNLLISFFNQAAFSDETIDREAVQFSEFDRMAESVNKMIFDKIHIRQELMSEREQLFVTIRSIGDGVITTDTKGRIELMNRVAEQLTGINIKEALGQPLGDIFKIVDAETIAAVENPVANVLETGNISDTEYNTKLVSRDGLQYHISHSAAPIKAKQETITGIVLVFRDISEEYRIRETLRESEKNFRILMEQSPIAMQVFDLNGFMINANKAFCDLWEVPDLGEVLGKYNLLKDPYLAKLGVAETIRTVFSGEPVDINEIAFDPGIAGFPGRNRIVNIKAYPLKNDDDSFKHIVIFTEDITEQKHIEKEMMTIKKLKSIGTLAGGIAHDFNNILMGVMGYLELSKLKLDPDDKVQKYIHEAENSLNRAKELTTQLLTFARGGAPVLQAVNLQQVVTESIKFNLSGSNIKACLDLPETILPVKADKDQLYQVVAHLTTNAREAMPEGGRFYVEAENIMNFTTDTPRPMSGDFVRLTLRDEGPGVSEQNLDRIFDPYFSTKEMGSGLGLATVHSIMSRHDGCIQVESSPGEGLIVRLYLPVEKDSDSSFTISDQISKKSNTASAKILIMDDEELIRRIAMMMLEKSGYSSGEASDGEEALDMYTAAKLEGKPYDIVIMDLTIPGGMGGKEAIDKLLEIDPDANVIVSSGYFTDPVVANFRDYGFKGRLTKPFKMGELLKEVRLLL